MPEYTNTSSSKSGVGAGSASVVLIFAVLCLTVFTLITYIVANNNKALVDAEAKLVTGYYEADTMAERILAGIMEMSYSSGSAGDAGSVRTETDSGTDIYFEYDEDLWANTAYFYCPVSDAKSLYVRVAIREDYFDILSWRMTDLDEWNSGGGINIWSGG